MSRIRTALANASWLAAGNTATQLIVLVGFIYIARRLIVKRVSARSLSWVT